MEELLQNLRAKMGELQLADQEPKPSVLDEVNVTGIVKHIRKIASSETCKFMYV